ncbi:hypothetical protein [Massilia soli]|uniref:Uncharacterized protein n=1 Tax=Massilia soli TaxID=2792854 RepID=A0ABS7SMT7_9BURK|nr:hypothetical protein [Massilia soli]MBZ2207491.1 hypothetical protein [Massilia soli]
MAYLDQRTNLATATVVNEGIAWRETYGTRSAAAFLAHRAIPRAVIQRVVNSGELRRATISPRRARAAGNNT